LIKNVGILLDMILLLMGHLNFFPATRIIRSFLLSLRFFVCICTWSEEDKLYYLSLI